MDDKKYILKGVTKNHIRYDGVSYLPGKKFYAEVSEKDKKFLSAFLENPTAKLKSQEE
jgi:hypothetical protein